MPKVEAQEFGARLRELRKQFGLTQRALAEKLDVDFSYLSKIESGVAPPPSEKVILRLAEVLNADRDELLTLAGKIPPDIAEALKNREARQLLRSKRTQTIMRTSNKISGSIKMGSQNLVNYGSTLKSSLSLARIAMVVVLVVTVATSLWFASPARAFDVDIDRPASGTLGTTYTFTVNVTIADSELLPIQNVNLNIYKSDDRTNYEASYANLPLGTGSQNHANTGDGPLLVTATATSYWASGYGYGYGYAEWQSTAYRFFSPGGYGYGYGYGNGLTRISYNVQWVPPSNWPPGTDYKIEAVITANGTTFTNKSGTFALQEPATGGTPMGAPPPVTPELGVTSVSDIVDSQGVFIQPATAKSEDSKVVLDIDKGTTGKTEAGTPLKEITMEPMALPPALPSNANFAGLTYDLGPDGATFDPSITITFTYDPADIPEGVNEEDLALAYWDGSDWVVLEGSVVNLDTNTITAPVSHFTAFTILAYNTPAAFTVSGLTISPTEVNIGEKATISITITNTGDLTGDYQAILKINGSVIATKKVTLAGDISQKVTFTTSKDAGGTYTVGLGGLSGTLTVKGLPVIAPTAPPVKPPAPPVKPPVVPVPAPAPPLAPPAITWPLISGIIAGVIVIGLVTWIILRRREIS